MKLASDKSFDFGEQQSLFERTFAALDEALGANAFKRWNGQDFRGKFLISVFEVLAPGVAKNIDAIESLTNTSEFIQQKAQELWDNETFKNNSGGGTRGTTRLINLLPMSEEFMKPA